MSKKQPKNKADLPEGMALFQTIDFESDVHHIAWSPNGATLAAAVDGDIFLWDLQTQSCSRLTTTAGSFAFAWSPDGRSLAQASNDEKNATVTVHDIQTAQPQRFEPEVGYIFGLSWSPDGKILAVAGQKLKILDANTGVELSELVGYQGVVRSVHFLTDGRLLSASDDHTVGIWDVRSGHLINKLQGHSGYVLGVISIGDVIVSCATDRTIRLWDAKTASQVGILEGHRHAITGISSALNGNIMASYSDDNTVRFWRLDTLKQIGVIEVDANQRLLSLAFHPTKPLLAAVDGQSIRIWSYDEKCLLGQPTTQTATRYTNAKVVLAGDTGVGKTALANSLIGEPFEATVSTHGRRVVTFDSHIDTSNNIETARETLLWDLAGQPGYRLVHQLNMDDATLALVLFDARSETDPFGGSDYWARALDQAQSNTRIIKFLVAARTDRGGVGISDARIQRFVAQYGFDGFFRTSAITGEGVSDLAEAIRKAIDWNNIPVVGSNQLFKAIRAAIRRDKARAPLELKTLASLHQDFAQSYDGNVAIADFYACLRRLQQTNMIDILTYSALEAALQPTDFVLLTPEIVDAYASAIVMAARDEPDGIGHLPEAQVLAGEFRLEAEERLPEPTAERNILVSVVETFIQHDIALREEIEGQSYLIFPSQYTRESPFPGSNAYGLCYDFTGPVKNIFTTLVVRLAHHTQFISREFYRDAACFAPTTGGCCIIVFKDKADGAGRVTIFFEADPAQTAQRVFLEYVYLHLQRHATPQSITRRRAYHCTNCQYLFDETVVERRLSAGKTDITCSNCDTTSPLFDLILKEEEVKTLDLGQIDEDAKHAMQRELAVSAIQGKKQVGDFDCLFLYDPAERTAVVSLAQQLKALGLRAWLDVWQLSPGVDAQQAIVQDMPRMRMAAICVGASGRGFIKQQQLQRLTEPFCDDARDGVCLVLLPGCKPAKPSRFLAALPQIDLRKQHEESVDPMTELVGYMIGANRDGWLFNQIDSFKNTMIPRAPIEDAGTDWRIRLPFDASANVFSAQTDFTNLPFQLAEWLNTAFQSVFMPTGQLQQQSLLVVLKQRQDALRLFAMARIPNSDVRLGFARWAIDSDAFLPENNTTEQQVREKPNTATQVLRDKQTDKPRVRMTGVKLVHFKCFETIQLDFTQPSTLPGSWVCLAGINGAGKTAILQAICIALLGEPSAQELGGDLLNRLRRRVDGVAQDARIILTLVDDSNGQTQAVALRLTASGIAPDSASGRYVQSVLDFWRAMREKVVLSYGATRNLSNHRDTRYDNVSLHTRRQMTLFDPLTQLVGAAALIRAHDADSAFATLLQRLLQHVFEQDIGFALIDGHSVFTVEDEAVEAMDLPDGFRSCVAWLADLCDAWCETCPKLAQTGDPTRIEAIILLDEIDLHLHPALQRALVPRLRSALPSVQWLVTTHSPLVLSSFDRAEIIALDRTEDSGVRFLDRQILGFSADQIVQWLMGTPTTSLALESKLEVASASEAEIAQLLTTSPEVDEEQAQEQVKQLMSQLQKY